MNQLSDRLNSLSPSATLAMSQKSAELKAQGVDVINLSVGEPDFNTPDYIKEAAKKAIDDNFSRYSPVPGYPALRNAIVEKLKKENDLEYTAAQISCANGAKQSVCNVILVLVNPGDEVIVPAPYWVSYPEMVKLAEGTPVIVTAGIEQDFKITPAQLEAAITPKTKALILCSPSNPTGSVYSQEELKGLADVLEKYPQVIVIADEIYEHINYIGKHQSIAQFPEMKERTVIVNGVSKAYAMTGWRIGFIAGPEWIVKACNKLQGQYTSGPCSVSQKAAEAAYLGSQAPVEEIAVFREARKVDDPVIVGAGGPAPRFAQIVERRPTELACKEVVVACLFPLLAYRYLARLIVVRRSVALVELGEDLLIRVTRHREEPFGVVLIVSFGVDPCVIGPYRAIHSPGLARVRNLRTYGEFTGLILVEIGQIASGLPVGIEPRDVQMCSQSPRLRGGTSAVQIVEHFVDAVLQVLVALPSPHFVAQAPHHDARMVAVAEDKIGKVALPPLEEIDAVVVRRLVVAAPVEPAVEEFVHHHKPKGVAHVVELGSIGVVARAHGVATHLFELHQTPVLHVVGHRGSIGRGILVQAHAFEFRRLAIQEEPFAGNELRFTHSERGPVCVGYLSVDDDLGREVIHVRSVGAPQFG